MGFFFANPNIPFATNNPSVDQPNMQTDTNSFINWTDVDHNGYNVQQGGYHTVVHCVDNVVDPPNVPPAGPLLGAGEYYAKTVTDFATDTAAFFQTAGGRIIQLTMNTTPVAATNGYSYLPGGIAIQWGQATFTSSGHTQAAINFGTANRNFPTACFVVIPNLILPVGSSTTVSSINITAISKTSFSWVYNGSSQGGANIIIQWIALGN